MSDTPRTDEQLDDARNVSLESNCRTPVDTGNCYVVPVEFARTLERELGALGESHRTLAHIEIELKTERDAWRACATSLAASLRSEIRGESAHYAESGQACAAVDLATFDKLKGTQ